MRIEIVRRPQQSRLFSALSPVIARMRVLRILHQSQDGRRHL